MTRDYSKWNKNDPYVPWGDKGMLNYAGWYGDKGYVPVKDFTAEIKLLRIEQGRSSRVAWIMDMATGYEYPMWYHDFEPLLLTRDFKAGVMQGTIDLTFAKKGANYGVVPK